MWSAAVSAILTTLRYLAPATLLTLFWGQQSFLFKLLKTIDNGFRAIVFSSDAHKQEVLRWLAEAGPTRVERLDTVWRHGWLLCGVLDAALPGACAGHPPTRLSLKHAQSIADHYLGVEPVFSRQELESNDSLSKHQEWKLATYLDSVRQALAKVSPPVSKPISQRTTPEGAQFTLDYVARGSGLTAAQVRNKAYFKIYPTAQQCIDPGEITILIRGPNDTYGTSVLPPIFGKAQLIRQKLLGLQTKPSFTENALPITHGAAYLRSYGNNDMNKTYYIPKEHYDIEVEVESKPEHARVGYVVKYEGRHEISITSRGQNIVGSPFVITASQNIIDILERESFCLEDGEEIDILDVKSDRKVVLRIVDFVTEKMLLKENGSLEKISDDEAKILMATDDNDSTYSQSNDSSFTSIDEPLRAQRFNTTAQKILKMNRICKIFNSIMAEKQKQQQINEKETFIKPSRQQGIPDIVNSTLSDCKLNRYVVTDKHNTVIIPENITVSLRTEKAKDTCKNDLKDTQRTVIPVVVEDYTEKKIILGSRMDEDIISIASSTSNPFFNDIYEQNYITEKTFGSFGKSEYETNRSKNEETTIAATDILVEVADNDTPSPLNTNPFFDLDVITERPKTPILKIITGEIKDRDDSVYVDPKIEAIAEELQANEFINPFFMHQHRHSTDDDNITSKVTDFIIGAPVSLPPILRAPTPEPTLDSFMVTTYENEAKDHNVPENVDDIFSTPLHTSIMKENEYLEFGANPHVSSTFHSLDSNTMDNVDIIKTMAKCHKQSELHIVPNISQSSAPKKDTWDSAYVSIDDSNSSPDSNNNDNVLCDTPKVKFSPSDACGLKTEDISRMGPAERELWLTCSDLNTKENNKIEVIRQCSKVEMKRKIFTPIIEESDRSISSGVKDNSRSDLKIEYSGSDTITVTFAELNDMYHEHVPSSENSSFTTIIEDDNKQHKEVQYVIENNGIQVDSASDQLSDVKRRAQKIEGEISEVQANVTESVSASQTLPHQEIELCTHTCNEIQFSDDKRINIVLERKKYWDDKIRQIEAKSDEIKTNQKKKRLSTRQLKQNDSLTKRRGKEMAKKILDVGDDVTQNVTEIIRQKYPTPQPSLEEETPTDVKLVKKWKKYWDEKLEIEREETDSIRSRSRSPKNVNYTPSPQQMEILETQLELKHPEVESIPKLTKQELPEEVFKAFETSPKRFFGTSRKQILNKLDSFSAKPSIADQALEDSCSAKHESGLVSSRISLFHTISQKVETTPWIQRKSQSMHDIYHRKDSEKSLSDETDTRNKTNQRECQKQNNINNTVITENRIRDNSSLKDKRARMTHKIYHNTYDETVYQKQVTETKSEEVSYDVKTIRKTFNNQTESKSVSAPVLCKKSISRSEMDIFNKSVTAAKVCDDDLAKHKSCEELPKINVKNFISLYETVTKSAVEPKLVRRTSTRMNELNSPQAGRQNSGVITKPAFKASNSTSSACSLINSICSGDSSSPEIMQSTHSSLSNNSGAKLSHKNQKQTSWTTEKDTKEKRLQTDASTDSLDIEIISMPDTSIRSSYLSLSDIEIEIVDSQPELSPETSPEREIRPELKDYKSRFAMAKNYFKSLEELRENKTPPKLNECETMLYKVSDESLESDDRPQKRVKKNIKAHSVPSSEISKVWKEMHETQDKPRNSKLVKISEKFNVDDLFNDVTEGRLSRQGSLRGIPHMKAVLATFRSMENVSVNKLSSYEMAVTQLSQFATENKIRNAQTYLTEYPYLPTTDPSKYHSRVDTKASGLISMKELLNKKPRRNSVPDLRLNPTFTVEL